MRLLLTRPLDDAEPMRQALAAMGHEVVVEPLLTVTLFALAAEALVGVQATLCTSRNGVRALAASPHAARLQALPAFAIGPGTAALLGQHGFTRVIVGAGRAADLVPLVATHCRPADGALLHPSGPELAFDLAPPLAALGFEVRRTIVYHTEAASQFGTELQRISASRGLDGVVLMSPETARVYVALVRRHGLSEAARDMVYLCLSPAVAAALSGLGRVAVHIAATPDSAGLLALVAQSRVVT